MILTLTLTLALTLTLTLTLTTVAGQERFNDDAYIKAAFDGIDADGSGQITLEEITQVRPRACVRPA